MTKFFTIEKKDHKSSARAGVIHTLHGDLPTPTIMIVGTKGTVKGISSEELKTINVPVVLCNTYHLFLSPGENLVADFGGLHGFMNWSGPIFTDSGGFQIFSMGHGTVSDEIKGKGNRHIQKTLLEISEHGAKFKSYLNGDIKLLTPEKSIEIQHKLGADMIAAFDECTPFHVDKFYTQRSMEMTHRWLLRCIKKHQKLNSSQALFGIVQGGIYQDLRKKSANFISKQNTKGICIGGSLGQDKTQMRAIVSYTKQLLPPEKPVHLLGIGDLDDLIAGVEMGIDTFDCVSPTRNARHGLLFSTQSKNFKLSITSSIFKNDHCPIDENCCCKVCQNYSRAYLRYLLKAKEILGVILCSHHNIHFITNFMHLMRKSILQDCFQEFKIAFQNQDNFQKICQKLKTL